MDGAKVLRKKNKVIRNRELGDTSPAQAKLSTTCQSTKTHLGDPSITNVLVTVGNEVTLEFQQTRYEGAPAHG